MTRQYHGRKLSPTVPTIRAQPAANKPAELTRLQDLTQDLQKELSRCRSEIARLKNRISDLERQVAPRG